MTGIERLREQVDRCKGWAQQASNDLADIAEQIERETEEQSARLYDERVGEETGVCELFGVEPVDDPLTSLRRHVENLNDTIENLRLELGEARDPAADVSMSAYDLLPQKDREAIAWVREHGGLAEVEKEWNVRSNLKRTCEKLRAKVERQQRHIEFAQGKCHERLERIAALNKTVADMRPRLMPEGMEWLVEAWPRFEDGELVRLLDDFERYGEENGVSAVTMYADGSFALNCRAYSKGERVNRPAPKVLDADGEEIRVGDTVYHVKDGSEMTVYGIEGEWLVASVGGRVRHDIVTHRAPVLAADGKPLREGETVWHMPNKKFVKTTGFTKNSLMRDVVDVEYEDGSTGRYAPNMLTYERPVTDTWERLEEDAAKSPCKYFRQKSCKGCPADSHDGCKGAKTVARDLLRRARALAERDA